MEAPVAAISIAANNSLLSTIELVSKISCRPRAQKFAVEEKSKTRETPTPANSQSFSLSQNR